MPGKKSRKRTHAVAKRCAKLYSQGVPISQISEATGVERGKVKTRIELGQRLISLEQT